MGDGIKVVSRILPGIPPILTVLVRLPIQDAAQEQKHEDTHRRHILTGLDLKYLKREGLSDVLSLFKLYS